MSWFRQILGLERDGPTIERKSIIGLNDGLSPWASRQDGTNFRTNQVTLADYMDRGNGNALGLSATYACVNLLAGTIASLPLMVYRTDAAGVRSADKSHPLYWLLHDSPNYDQTAYDFWEFMAAAIELQGNGYAKIERREFDGLIISLTPIRPDIVKVERKASGDLSYEWNEGLRRNIVAQTDMLHIRGFGGNPLGGSSALSACRQIFSAALATDAAAATMFANGARPSGILSTDKPMTGEQRTAAEKLLGEKFSGSLNAGRPMLLDNGVKWEQLTISPEDAQMLESRKFSGEEVCRVFGIPPAMVGFGDKASNWGTGKEQDVLGFQKFTLRKRLKRIEQALMKQLLTRQEQRDGISIEFNFDALLRGDSESRSKFYDTLIKVGVMTRNEARRLENLPPVEGGDVVMVQMQDVPLATALNPVAPGKSDAEFDRLSQQVARLSERQSPPPVVNVRLPEMKAPEVYVEPAQVSVTYDGKRSKVVKTVTGRDAKGLIETWTEEEKA